MSIETLTLRKFLVTEVANNKKTVIATDLYENIDKTVYIQPTKRPHFNSYAVGKIIYGIRSDSQSDTWYLVTESEFKTTPALAKGKVPVDNYFKSIGYD
ncbi:MAG TPA: hypothetical protein DCS93_02710 [Microscillaceae bacterium]|nr:hypothetical protein [Microscillaceae bacterium]